MATNHMPSVTDDPNFNPDKCWFCQERSAPDASRHPKIGMFRQGKYLGEEKGADGKTHQRYEWDTVKFPVPRCGRCEMIHNSRAMIELLPVLGILLVTLGAFTWKTLDMTPKLDGIEVKHILGVGGMCALFAYVVARNISGRMAAGIRDEYYSEYYPVIVKLVRDGWTIGKCPDASLFKNETQAAVRAVDTQSSS